MGVDFIYPEFEVVRNKDRCIGCRVCERQCANEVHWYDSDRGVMMSDETKCVNCQRCVSLCPTRALKIVKSDCRLRENANWPDATIKEVYKQAGSGGVLLSSMGNPNPLPVYWDKILINASQVTNPPIDPLREPMETKVFLGKKPDKIERDENGNVAALSANALKINKIARDTASISQKILQETGENGVMIPIGALTGIEALAGAGKRINIDILPVCSVVCSFSSAFESVGINQTKHSIYLNVLADISIVMASRTDHFAVQTDVLAGECVIVGKIPEMYFQTDLSGRTSGL